MSSKQPETEADVAVIGVPAIHQEVAGRFAEERTERQTRYLLEKKILPGRKVLGQWVSGQRSLHRRIDELLGE
jgi:hypothetical protein